MSATARTTGWAAIAYAVCYVLTFVTNALVSTLGPASDVHYRTPLQMIADRPYGDVFAIGFGLLGAALIVVATGLRRLIWTMTRLSGPRPPAPASSPARPSCSRGRLGPRSAGSLQTIWPAPARTPRRSSPSCREDSFSQTPLLSSRASPYSSGFVGRVCRAPRANAVVAVDRGDLAGRARADRKRGAHRVPVRALGHHSVHCRARDLAPSACAANPRRPLPPRRHRQLCPHRGRRPGAGTAPCLASCMIDDQPRTSVPMPAAQLLVQLVTWPLVAALAWRAARARASPVAWVVVVLLAAPTRSHARRVHRASLGRAGCSRSWASASSCSSASIPMVGPTPRWIVVPVSIEIALQAINVASSFSLEAQPWWPWHFLVSLGVTLLGGQVYRYRRRSSVDEREQTRWPVLAMLAMVFAYTLGRSSVVGLGLEPERGTPSLAVLLTVLPGVGFAVGLLVPRGVNVDVALRWCLLIGLRIGDCSGRPSWRPRRSGAPSERAQQAMTWGSGRGGGGADHSAGGRLRAGGRPLRLRTSAESASSAGGFGAPAR